MLATMSYVQSKASRKTMRLMADNCSLCIHEVLVAKLSNQDLACLLADLPDTKIDQKVDLEMQLEIKNMLGRSEQRLLL